MKSRMFRIATGFALLFCCGSALADTHYVSLSGGHTPPFTNWPTAATNIQAAIDEAVDGDTVLVTNGVYETGGAVTPGYACMNRVCITDDITVESVNGRTVTIIKGAEATGGGRGDDAVRGVFMTAGTLSGFTVTNGHTRTFGLYDYDQRGGGVNMYGGNGVVTNCTLSGNTAYNGGGSHQGTLINCTISGNSALRGGGSYSGTLNNCTISGNSAYEGGGSYGGTLINCTISGNSADNYGGGNYAGTLRNCIVYYNTAGASGDNWHGDAAFTNSCTTPHPGGTANITNAPLLVSASHIASNSPCRGAGSAAYAAGTDIDGEAWLDPPSIGCDEYHGPGTATGPLELSFSGPTNLCAGFVGTYRVDIQGVPHGIVLDLGDGTRVTNTLLVNHAWALAGTYDVVLSGWNEDYPGGVSVTTQVQVAAVEESSIYVSDATGSDANDGRSWPTAKKSIQAGVDAQDLYGGMVWVSNGVYRVSSEIVVDRTVRVVGIGGPEATVVDGGGSVRCFSLGRSPSLVAGFTLTNGYSYNGGGVYCENLGSIVSNCTISGNHAHGSYSSGGGSFGGTLINCTISGNSTGGNGGGSCRSTLNSCTISGNSAWGEGGGSFYGTLNNCTISGNSGNRGGGSWRSTLNNCTISGNSAVANLGWGGSGGGCYRSTLNNCTISGNHAPEHGGGSYGSALINCTIVGNTADEIGGGIWLGTISNCTISGNSARDEGGGSHSATLISCTISGNSAVHGGGSYRGTLNNCTISGNRAQENGGGCYGATLNNCTVSGNVADNGGGSYQGTLNNCIVYYNRAFFSGDNWHDSTFTNSCTTPHPGGTGNITDAPLLVSASHIASNSPCRGAGSAAYATGTDIDGEAWLDPPSIGCDEYRGPGTVTGSLELSLSGPTNLCAGFAGSYWVNIQGAPHGNVLDFGDGTSATNVLQVDHAWAVAGTYKVVFSAWNDEYPGAVFTTQVVHVASVEESAVYVSDATGDDTHDGRSWSTAKKTIQAGVDAQDQYGGIVWVSNGVYAVSSEIVVDRAMRVIGTAGPVATVVDGGGAVGCFVLERNPGLIAGFTLTNGYAVNGGGVYCHSLGSMVSNCVISGNSARAGGGSYGATLNNCIVLGNAARVGGGSYGGTLNNCTISGNSASSEGGGSSYGTLSNCAISGNSAESGGGSYRGTLKNCTISGNSATGSWPQYGGFGGGSWRSTLESCTISGNWAKRYGGGNHGGTLNNCIVYHNRASVGGNNYYSCTLTSSCTTPHHGGTGNITNAPQFVDAAASDFHLSATSPCINVGANQDWMIGAVDLEGLPRILGDIVDMGAYEFPSPELLLEELIGLVNTCGHSPKQPLLATLYATLASVQRGNAISAINQALAFQNTVQAQVEPTDPALGAALIESAQQIVDLLSGGQTNPGSRPHGRFIAMRNNPDGRVQFQFRGVSDRLYSVEGSTDLMDWEPIGLATHLGDGVFFHKSTNGAAVAHRFFRVVSEP